MATLRLLCLHLAAPLVVAQLGAFGFGGGGGNAAPASPFGGAGVLGGVVSGLGGGLSGGAAAGAGGMLGTGLGGGALGAAAAPASGSTSPEGPSLQVPVGSQPPPEDMACLTGPHAKVWHSVKNRFREVAEPFQVVSRETLLSTLNAAMEELNAAKVLEATDECGLGRLCLQILSLITMEDPTALAQLFGSLEQLSSPVMTLLLDIPWWAVAQARWPVFGLLAQINLRKVNTPGLANNDAVDGISDPITQAFYQYLMQTLQQGDVQAMGQGAVAYVQQEKGSSAIGPLTAMSIQAASVDAQQSIEIFQALQGGLKQVIGTGAELDVLLSTQWPLWGLLTIGLDQLPI